MENIIETIEAGQHVKEVYTPYAMSTIVDRALPDVKDGFKPIHRRILFSSYKAGIRYNKDRSKTGELVSETMKIHHHGNSSVEEAIALMTEQNESQLHPYLDGEGAFGKCYSTDSPSPPRYTYCRLNLFSEEFFIDYDKNILPMVGEDKEHLQPITLSSSFPNILIKTNTGIACGESCSFPSFNLDEVCNTTIEYIKNKDINLLDYLYAPDFSSKGYILYNQKNLEQIYNTGKGSIILRGKYKYDNENNCIEIFEIPYNTTADSIILKINDLMKKNKFNILKSIIDIRDETGFNEDTQREELKITIDVKKNTNIKSLMTILFKKTPLESIFSVNMNCLVDCEPRVLNIKQILDEWLKFRVQCITNGLNKDLNLKNKELQYLIGLEKILFDTDKAINIIKESEENEINKNLAEHFNISLEHANTIANMKLKNINEIYIKKQIISIPILKNEIKKIENTLNSEEAINDIIIKELKRIKTTYSKPRMTEILYEDNIHDITKEDLIEDHSVTIVLTKEQYLKKTLKYSENQTTKEGDEVIQILQTTNKKDLLLFTDQGRVFTRKIYELTGKVECTPSALGEFIPNILKDNLNKDEKIIYIVSPETYDKGYMLYIFENNNIVKMAMKPYYSPQNRMKAQEAYNTESPLKYIKYIERDIDILTLSSEGKMLIQNTEGINPKTSQGGKKSQGNTFVKLEDNNLVGVIFEPKEDDIIKFKTEKKDCVETKLSDVCQSSKDKLTYYNHCKGKKNNAGNFIYNCRQKNDKIVEVIISK